MTANESIGVYLMCSGELAFIDGNLNIKIHEDNHLIFTIIGVSVGDCMRRIHQEFGWRPYYPNVPMNYSVAPIDSVWTRLAGRGVKPEVIEELKNARNKQRNNMKYTVDVYRKSNGKLHFSLPEDTLIYACGEKLITVSQDTWVACMEAIHRGLNLGPYKPIDREMDEMLRLQLDKAYYASVDYKKVKVLCTNHGSFVYPITVEIYTDVNGKKYPHIGLRNNNPFLGNTYVNDVYLRDERDIANLRKVLGISLNDLIRFK